MNTKVPNSVSEFANEEREFLHNLSNPLAIAAGMLEAYQDEIARLGPPLSETLERKLTKLDNALERIGDLIAKHRTRLIEIADRKKS